MTRVAKPLCPQDNNGFRGERAGVDNNSEISQRSERTGLKGETNIFGGQIHKDKEHFDVHAKLFKYLLILSRIGYI